MNAEIAAKFKTQGEGAQSTMLVRENRINNEKFVGKVIIGKMEEAGALLVLEICSHIYPDDSNWEISKWIAQFACFRGKRGTSMARPLDLSSLKSSAFGEVQMSQWAALIMALGAPEIILKKGCIPRYHRDLVHLPLSERLKFIQTAVEREQQDTPSSVFHEMRLYVLEKIYDACANNATALTLWFNDFQNTGPDIHPFIQLLPELNHLHLPDLNFGPRGMFEHLGCLKNLRYIPVAARRNILEHGLSKRLLNPASNENLRAMLQACDTGDHRLLISSDDFPQLAIFTWLLPDLRELKIQKASNNSTAHLGGGIVCLAPLKKLTISAPSATGFACFDAMWSQQTSLEELELNHIDDLRSLEHIEYMWQLRRLTLHDVQNLEQIVREKNVVTKLQEFSLSAAPRLTNITGIGNFSKLAVLKLSSVAQLHDISELEKLPKLRRIVLGGNSVSEMLSRLANIFLPAGVSVHECKSLPDHPDIEVEVGRFVAITNSAGGAETNFVPTAEEASPLSQLSNSMVAMAEGGTALAAEGTNSMPAPVLAHQQLPNFGI